MRLGKLAAALLFITLLDSALAGTAAGWHKSASNPVIGPNLGTVFDVCLLKESGKYRMWASWRPKKSIALFESSDGIHWSDPVIVLGPNPATSWEQDINRPIVLKNADGYHMWYTGQTETHSSIGYATSADGLTWKRMAEHPVLSPGEPWEKVAVMCPHVMWDPRLKLFRMWYSGGDQYEPDAIGYATSSDGLHWRKLGNEPVFRAGEKLSWEQDKVTACQVVLLDGWYYMFYIGFRDIDHAQIGIARSRNGVSNWQRLPQNPIVSPTRDEWDADACYKPFAIFDGHRWNLWYNGRKGSVEQIGLVIHEGRRLWPR